MRGKSLWRFALILFFLWSGCSKEDNYSDVDGLVPTIELGTENIKTEAGRGFVITAKVADSDGLKSIHLLNQDIYLDKTIDLTKDSTIFEYDLNYLNDLNCLSVLNLRRLKHQPLIFHYL